MDIKKEIESYIDACNECEERYVASKNYGDALYIRGVSYGYERVLRLLEEYEEQERKKTFSWNNVKIGDEVVNNDNVYGKVVGLIYTEKGFSGMRVCYEKYGDCCITYQDDDYNFFKRIGEWVGKERD